MPVMALAALVVAIASLIVAVVAVLYARRLEGPTKRTAVATEAAAVLDTDRRHAELTPHFRVTFQRFQQPDSEVFLVLSFRLTGPFELKGLDLLTVTILDDEFQELFGKSMAFIWGEKPVETQIWGPYRFRATAGRTVWVKGLGVSERKEFILEPSPLPSRPEWLPPELAEWLPPELERSNTMMQIRLDSYRKGWGPWMLSCEIETSGDLETVDI